MSGSAPGEPDDARSRQFEQLKLEALADFAAGAGHEMNNPLAVIAGRAQLLLRDETDRDRRASLALIWAQAQRVHEMIADVMLFARPPAPQFEQIEWGSLLRRVLHEAAAELPERAVKLELNATEPSAFDAAGVLLVARLPSRPVAAQADPDQLAVAIRALLRNAIEAVESGGRVELAAEAGPDELIVEISDNGPGISAEARSHIFNPFYSGRQAGRGLGVGLCKAWRLITLHGGTINVDQSPLGGARFRVAVPFQPCPVDRS